MRSREEIAVIAQQLEFGHPGELAATTAKRSLRLSPKEHESAELRPGRSKFGGYPDLPPEVSWPESGALKSGKKVQYDPHQYEPGPMRFIAQINLGDMPLIPEGLAFPGHGLISFFAATQKVDLPFTDCTTDDWKVLFHPDGEALAPLGPPALSEEFIVANRRFSDMPPTQEGSIILAEHTISFEEDFVPNPVIFYGSGCGTGPVRAYFNRVPEHLVGGYPNFLQYPIEPIAEDFRRLDSRWSKANSEWLLLAQFDTDKTVGLTWSGGGRGFFMIPRDALERQSFDETVLVVQQT